MVNRDSARRLLSTYLEDPAARVLTRAGFSPNVITLLGLLGAAASAYLLAVGFLAAGGLVLLLSAVFDLFDGAVARATGRVSKFGALLDSTVDRASEAAVLLGLLVHYLGEASTVGAVLVYVALSGSLLVSYVRARAGGLRVDCQVGVFTRSERVVALGITLIIGQWWPTVLLVVLGAIGALTIVTTVQRVLHVRRELAAREGRKPGEGNV